jgi:hypothetical protein
MTLKEKVAQDYWKKIPEYSLLTDQYKRRVTHAFLAGFEEAKRMAKKVGIEVNPTRLPGYNRTYFNIDKLGEEEFKNESSFPSNYARD